MSEIDEILDIVAKNMMIDRHRLPFEARLADLDLNSLDMVEIIFAPEEKFGIEPPFNANASARAIVNAIGDAGLVLIEDMAPPSVNYLGPDPVCDLDYVPNESRKLKIRAALNNSFAFGGLNAVVAVWKTDEK